MCTVTNLSRPANSPAAVLDALGLILIILGCMRHLRLWVANSDHPDTIMYSAGVPPDDARAAAGGCEGALRRHHQDGAVFCKGVHDAFFVRITLSIRSQMLYLSAPARLKLPLI